VNPWVLGNVVIGGIPGLVVDNATGAAWRPKCSEIHSQLTAIEAETEQPKLSSGQRSSIEPVDPAQYSTEEVDSSANGASSKHRLAKSATTAASTLR
jgi:hypothetical protein